MSENRTRFRLDQRRAPIYEALERFRQMRVVPFDVPGHKRGRGNPELTAFLGQQCVGVDVNSMKPLDNLCHPVSVIREAEELAADAFGAAHAFLMVGGTTSSVQSMVLTACKRGDEIILPRNVHRSVLNALVLCGAVPVYVNPEVDKRLGISLGMKREQVEKAIKELRAERGVSQEEFANLIGMSRSYFGEVETGKRNVAAVNLEKIAKGLGVSLAEFFDSEFFGE